MSLNDHLAVIRRQIAFPRLDHPQRNKARRSACRHLWDDAQAVMNLHEVVVTRAGSGVSRIVGGSIVREAISHRLFGRERACVGFPEVVETLRPSCSVVIRGLMMSINQS